MDAGAYLIFQKLRILIIFCKQHYEANKFLKNITENF